MQGRTAVRLCALGMQDAFRGALSVKVIELLQETDVLHGHSSGTTRGHTVLTVSCRDSEGRDRGVSGFCAMVCTPLSEIGVLPVGNRNADNNRSP